MEPASEGPPPDLEARYWGHNSALLDQDAAKRRLLEAVTRCIVRRGSAAISMSEVANEARVSRSTLYRYFPSRTELITALLLSRTESALLAVVADLADPDDPARSLPQLVLGPISLVDGSPVNEALFSPESQSFVTGLELESEPLVEAALRVFGPLLERWQAAGTMRTDLDLRDTIRWINAISLLLLSPQLRHRTQEAKHEFLMRYLVRAVVVDEPPLLSSQSDN